MSAPDAPVEPVARPRQPVVDLEAVSTSPEVKTESPVGGTDFGSRLGLTAGSPQETLQFFGDLTRNANLTGMPEVFGRFDVAFNSTDLTGMLNPRNRQNQYRDQTTDRRAMPGDTIAAPTDFSAARRPEELPPGVSKIERTRVTGTGSNKDTQVEIRYGMDGKPSFVRDHLGEWKSEGGGKTWKTGEPNLRVRRGEVSIDANGNYSYSNDDYGVKSTFSPDGNVTRTITNAAGEQFSVTRDKQGKPVGFADKDGEWTGDGKNWKNSKTGETKNGTVALTEFGQFRFKPEKGDAVVAQTPQLERSYKLQEELTRQFGVKFAKPGEQLRNDDREPGRPKEATLYAGVPTEAELKVLKDTLTNTNHENYKNMKLWFIRPDESDRSEYATYDGPDLQRQEHHGCACHSKAAQKDIDNGELVLLPRARQELSGSNGLEGTLYHELGHHEQRRNLGWEHLVGPKATPEGRKLGAEMGWQWSERHQAPVMQDKTGGLWRFDEDKEHWRWAGGRQPADGKHRLGNEQMRERAKIPGISSYNDSPFEMHAEAIAGFRVGETGKEKPGDRRTLAIDSPKLYETIKKYDQERINKLHPPGPGGEPSHIRGLDGKIIENSAENRRVIAEREYRWKLEHLSEPKLPKRR